MRPVYVYNDEPGRGVPVGVSAELLRGMAQNALKCPLTDSGLDHPTSKGTPPTRLLRLRADRAASDAVLAALLLPRPGVCDAAAGPAYCADGGPGDPERTAGEAALRTEQLLGWLLHAAGRLDPDRALGPDDDHPGAVRPDGGLDVVMRWAGPSSSSKSPRTRSGAP